MTTTVFKEGDKYVVFSVEMHDGCNYVENEKSFNTAQEAVDYVFLEFPNKTIFWCIV